MTRTTQTTIDVDGESGPRRIHLREVSGEAQPRTVGEDLCAARLRRGDDLATVSRALRIRKDHLQAVEDSRVEDLPGRTYAIGFVRSYAGYLGLDPSKAVERFKGEIAGRNDGAPQIGWIPDTGGGLPYGWMIMAVIVVAVVAYGAWQLVRSADVFSPQVVAPVPARIASAPVHRATLRPQPVQARAETPPVPGATGSASSQLTPAAPQGASTAAAGAPASQGVQTAALPVGEVYGLQNRNARVVLHIRAVTEVLVEGPGGKVYINRVLHPGDSYRVPALVGLSLTTPDGGAVALELDGQDIGLAGRAGQMTEALSLDPQAIVDRTAKGNPG